MPFQFVDRVGNSEVLEAAVGERVADVLRRHRIPCSSVIVCAGDEVIGDGHCVVAGVSYEARLIEGYDINAIRVAMQATLAGAGDGFLKRRVVLSSDGALIPEARTFDQESIVEHVVSTIADTATSFNLIREGERVLVGLSGGVDSSSLLIALHAARAHLPRFEIVAATFEDFDARTSPTFQQANDLAQELGVEHHLVPASLVERAFRLNAPLREILPALMATKHAASTMYVDHHTTRRALELFADQVKATRISLGLHATDLLAGLLNGLATGYRVGSLPLRRVGSYEYIYPLCFLSKRELHYFHLAKRGFLARHSAANAWERNPLDRNLYYYLADTLQDYWPGLEAYVFDSHNVRTIREGAVLSEICDNCGSSLIIQPFMPAGKAECEVCSVLSEAGYRSA